MLRNFSVFTPDIYHKWLPLNFYGQIQKSKKREKFWTFIIESAISGAYNQGPYSPATLPLLMVLKTKISVYYVFSRSNGCFGSFVNRLIHESTSHPHSSNKGKLKLWLCRPVPIRKWERKGTNVSDCRYSGQKFAYNRIDNR